MKVFPVAAVLLGALFVSGCVGHMVDKKCIRGRLSEEQANAINAEHWGKLPSYNKNHEGTCKHCAKAGDRVLASECSDFLKEVTLDY